MAIPAFDQDDCPLLEKIRARIARGGAISYHDYMGMALYDPVHGYYAPGPERVGKEGDFITSVSVGRCFGLILARRLLAFWEQLGNPDSFHIIEPGAHDGALCADILAEIRSGSPGFYNAIHYHLVEATPGLQKAQQTILAADFAGKYSCHESLGDIRVNHGVLLSNELVDSFPVELITFSDGTWWQLFVDEAGGKLRFTRRQPACNQLQAFCDSLGSAFPEAYVTEFNPGIRDFARDAAAALASGLMITIDYGMQAGEYYHPDRTTGTLQTYHRHLKADDPLEQPGEIDITCHVDFTRLTSESTAAGFSEPRLVSQASYLTTHARDWLLSMETRTEDSPDAQALLRQFQTLTHPSMLGTRFMVLEMHK